MWGKKRAEAQENNGETEENHLLFLSYCVGGQRFQKLNAEKSPRNALRDGRAAAVDSNPSRKSGNKGWKRGALPEQDSQETSRESL